MDRQAGPYGAIDENAPPLKVRPISADSHVIEPPSCYTDFIDPAFRDIAPRLVRNNMGGDVYQVHGMHSQVPLGTVTAAGKDPRKIRMAEEPFDALHRGGWDPVQRLKDQDQDGVAAEVLYPSVGMVLCNHPDQDYKQACFMAYNRWLESFVAAAPDRLHGIGQTAVRSVAEAVADLRRMKAMGFRGVMLPGNPSTEEDYDHPSFDALWEAAADLGMPVSFHILTSGGRNTNSLDLKSQVSRGASNMAASHTVLRACQDVVSMLIWSRVFERFPRLRVVCVEADGGWVPHFAYRMDRVYQRHRFWMKGEEMQKLPSAYFLENVYFAFQDDWVAFKVADLCNPQRLMWGNDFPHSDSTWPWSLDLLRQHTRDMGEQQKAWILRDNVRELYGLPDV
jgi:predicted TIM-barrel fold metal-dependent hydrolase